MHVSRRGREGPDELVLGIDADVVFVAEVLLPRFPVQRPSTSFCARLAPLQKEGEVPADRPELRLP